MYAIIFDFTFVTTRMPLTSSYFYQIEIKLHAILRNISKHTHANFQGHTKRNDEKNWKILLSKNTSHSSFLQIFILKTIELEKKSLIVKSLKITWGFCLTNYQNH